MFPPIPNPLTIVVESATSESSWWQTWGPTLIPLLVSLVALGGVIYAQRKTGENMITAEQERARLAEIAENKRAQSAIEADDRRAKAAIEAEDRRHANDLVRATRDHMLDSVRDLYAEIEDARRALYDASYPVSELSVGDVDNWRSEFDDERRNFEAAFNAFAAVRDKTSLLGSDEVSQLCSQVFGSAFTAALASDSLQGKGLFSVIETEDSFRAKHRQLRKDCGALLTQMRKELHPTQGGS